MYKHIAGSEGEETMDTGNQTPESSAESYVSQRNPTPDSDLDRYVDALVEAHVDDMIIGQQIELLRWNPISQKWE